LPKNEFFVASPFDTFVYPTFLSLELSSPLERPTYPHARPPKYKSWYDNEAGYSKRMAELCNIAAATNITKKEPSFKYE